MNTFAMRSQLRKTALRGTTTMRCKPFAAITLAIAAALSLAFVAPQHAVAQAQNTGSIYGSAVDPSGAVIPNATVSVLSADTAAERTATTNKNGEYTVQNLSVGTYTLTVTAPGFESFVVDGITVDADSNTKIVAKLTIGSTKEITVEAESSAVDARSATLGTLIDNKLVEDLPIDGRNVVAMAGLLPGVTEVNAPTAATGDQSGPTFSAGGSRVTQNLMLFDGLMWNNLFFNTGVNYPPPNGLQEISVLLNNYKAQYGRNSGSVFNVITRSGTNTIHGAIWDYFHNQLFDAQDRINYLPTLKAPEDNINQVGMTMGGPIKRDKIFFFATFQDIIQRLQNVGHEQTPDANERGFLLGSPNLKTAMTAAPAYDNPCTAGGPFAGMMCASFRDAPNVTTTKCYNGVCAPYLNSVHNPAEVTSSSTGASWTAGQSMLQTAWNEAGNTGQAPCINELGTTAQTYANSHYYESDLPSPGPGLPALPGNQTDSTFSGANEPNAEFPVNCLNPVMGAMIAKYSPVPFILPNGQYDGISVAPQPKNDTNITFRIDWMVNQKHTIDMRYNLIRGFEDTALGVNSTTSVGNANYEIDHETALSNFGNIGDTWVVTPNMVNTLRVGYKRYENVTNPNDNHTLANFNSPGPGFGAGFYEPGVPVLPVISNSGQNSLGSINQGFQDHVNEDIEILEQLAWSHGKHNYQFGANFLRLQYLNNADYPGQISTGTTFTSVAHAEMALGFVGNVQANSPLVQAGIQHNIFLYAQDDWRITAKLTLNLGARYELPFQWYQPTGYSSTFIPGFQSTRFPGAVGGLAYPGDPGVRSSLVPTDFNGLVPRVGFAYDVFGTGKFAIRGGFGMFFDAVNANVIGVGEPFYYQTYTLFPYGGASDPLLQNGGTRIVLPSGYNKANPQFTGPYTLFFPDRNFRTPYVEAVNIGFQYKIPHGGTLEANYVGKFSRKLTIPYDQNPAITQCSGGYYNANPSLYGNASCSVSNPGSTASGLANSGPSSTQQRLRYTQFNYGGAGLVDFASLGTGSYNALQMQYTQRGGRRLTMLMSYTYSKSFDLQSDGKVQAGNKTTIPDPFNVSSERGLSDFDARHILNMGWSYNLPVTRTAWEPVRAVVNNWNFSGIYTARTGQPLNITINSDAALDGEQNQRAEIVPGMNPRLPTNRHRADKINEWFNPNAFTYPVQGTFSKVPRNAFTGPAFINTNFSLGRFFPLDKYRQGMKLQFRAEALNVFNMPNLGPPGTVFSCSQSSISNAGLAPCAIGVNASQPYTINSVGFGTVQSTYGTNGGTESNGRKMQFSLTLYY